MIPEPFRKRRIALPYEHGSYALYLSPLAIGLFAGGRWHIACVYLLVACSAGFLMRQPLTVLVMIQAGRRTVADRPAALFWLLAYGLVTAAHLTGLVLRGFGFVLHLAVPGALVAGWHLLLVRRRAERRRVLLEVLAAGVLALCAPAGLWVGGERYDPLGWLLWVLVWAAAAVAILHTYLRLAQRPRPPPASRLRRLRDGRLPLALAVGNVLGVLVLGATGVVPLALVLPYVLQLADVLHGALRPAWKVGPKRIGMQQLVVLTLFTVAFVLAWRA